MSVRIDWFGLVMFTPSRGRKKGIPRVILPYVQGAVGARLKPLFQGNRVGSTLFQTQPGIREGSYGQFYPNIT